MVSFRLLKKKVDQNLKNKRQLSTDLLKKLILVMLNHTELASNKRALLLKFFTDSATKFAHAYQLNNVLKGYQDAGIIPYEPQKILQKCKNINLNSRNILTGYRKNEETIAAYREEIKEFGLVRDEFMDNYTVPVMNKFAHDQTEINKLHFIVSLSNDYGQNNVYFNKDYYDETSLKRIEQFPRNSFVFNLLALILRNKHIVIQEGFSHVLRDEETDQTRHGHRVDLLPLHRQRCVILNSDRVLEYERWRLIRIQIVNDRQNKANEELKQLNERGKNVIATIRKSESKKESYFYKCQLCHQFFDIKTPDQTRDSFKYFNYAQKNQRIELNKFVFYHLSETFQYKPLMWCSICMHTCPGLFERHSDGCALFGKKICKKPFTVSEVLQAQENFLQENIQSNQTNNRSSTSMQIEP